MHFVKLYKLIFYYLIIQRFYSFGICSRYTASKNFIVGGFFVYHVLLYTFNITWFSIGYCQRVRSRVLMSTAFLNFTTLIFHTPQLVIILYP